MRETFMLELALTAEKDKASEPIFIATHQIVSIKPKTSGCLIETNSNQSYHVIQTIDDIRKKTRNVGTMVVL